MPGIMTRAEAICVCNNIIDLEEDLSEILPSGYSPGDTARSMKQRLIDNPRYTHVTEKMDGALRRMWGGLRKWDRKDEHNDDMFWGLADVINDLSDAAEEKAAEDAVDAAAPPVKGIESSDPEDDLTPEQKAMLESKRQSAVKQQETKAARQERQATVAAKSDAIVNASQQVEIAAKAREEALAVVLNQAHGKHLSVVKVDDIRHGQIENVLNKTSSDRTTQLLFAAFYAGKISGIGLCYEELRKAILK